MLKYMLILAYVISLAFVSGCNSEPGSPVTLKFGLDSQVSLSNIQSLLSKNDASWSLLEEDVSRAEYSYVRLETNHFEDATYKGTTHLIFFQNKLMSVWFYPADWGEYMGHLVDTKNIKKPGGSWEEVSGGVRTWIGADYLGNNYIAWEDVAITKLMQDWLDKN